MDINANLKSMGGFGRLARIGAALCLLVACILLLVSLASPSGAVADESHPLHTRSALAY